MRKTSSARRVPRKVGQDDDEPLRESSGGEDSSGRGMRQHHPKPFETSLTLRHSKRYQLTPEGQNRTKSELRSSLAKPHHESRSGRR
jgi:ribosomal protein S6E (S10)